jgi:hypothetical protein
MVVHGTLVLIGAAFPHLFGEVPASSAARTDPRHAV